MTATGVTLHVASARSKAKRRAQAGSNIGVTSMWRLLLALGALLVGNAAGAEFCPKKQTPPPTIDRPVEL